jgi:hypothetical protein
MFQLCCIAVSLLCVSSYAETKKPLPPFSAERFDQIVGVLRSTEFPVKIGILCDRLGGDDFIRVASWRSNGERGWVYFHISDDTSDKGVFELEVSITQQEASIPDWKCSSPRLLYLREGIEFYFRDNFTSSDKKPNQSPEPMPLKRHGSS